MRFLESQTPSLQLEYVTLSHLRRGAVSFVLDWKEESQHDNFRGDVLPYDDERSSHLILRYDCIVQRYLRGDIGHYMVLSWERPVTPSNVDLLRFCSLFFCCLMKMRFEIAISTGIFGPFFSPFSFCPSVEAPINQNSLTPKFLWLTKAVVKHLWTYRYWSEASRIYTEWVKIRSLIKLPRECIILFLPW